MTDSPSQQFVMQLLDSYNALVRRRFGTHDPRAVEAISLALQPALRGFSPEVQGAILADLVALWLAGHVGPEAPALREQLLAEHIRMVRELTGVNEKVALERMDTKGRG